MSWMALPLVALLAGPTPPTKAPAVGTVKLAAQKPDREVPSGKARVFFLAEGKNAFLGKLELAAGAKVPEHQDATEEYIHVLEGEGVLTMNGVEHQLAPGATVFMPAGATVSYQNGPKKMVAIQVFAGPAPAAKYQKWKAVTP